jgi:hypothetical protein
MIIDLKIAISLRADFLLFLPMREIYLAFLAQTFPSCFRFTDEGKKASKSAKKARKGFF